MSMPAAPHAAPDARTLLTSLLELIGQTHRIQDITRERLHAVTGLHVENWGPTRYGFRGDLTPQWGYIGDVDVARKLAPGMEFQFVPTAPGSDPDTAEICALDFTVFDKALRGAGFESQPHYGEHGEILWHDYLRGPLRVEVESRGAVTATTQKACVTSVVLR